MRMQQNIQCQYCSDMYTKKIKKEKENTVTLVICIVLVRQGKGKIKALLKTKLKQLVIHRYEDLNHILTQNFLLLTLQIYTVLELYK